MSIRKLVREEVTNAVATYYTSDQAYTQITAATAENKSASPETVTVYVVDSGGTSSDANALVIEGKSIPANDTLGIAELVGQVLHPDETIQIVASANSAITAFISGDVKPK